MVSFRSFSSHNFFQNIKDCHLKKKIKIKNPDPHFSSLEKKQTKKKKTSARKHMYLLACIKKTREGKLLGNNNETSQLSIEDAMFGCTVQLWGSKHRRHFCSDQPCGVQTGLASLLCLLSSGLLSMLKREMS